MQELDCGGIDFAYSDQENIDINYMHFENLIKKFYRMSRQGMDITISNIIFKLN